MGLVPTDIQAITGQIAAAKAVLMVSKRATAAARVAAQRAVTA